MKGLLLPVAWLLIAYTGALELVNQGPLPLAVGLQIKRVVFESSELTRNIMSRKAPVFEILDNKVST